jgi:AGZA family xanthine/uracil permease-like MFS transporter
MLLATIQDGMAIGFIIYVLLSLATGRARRLSPATLILAAIFLARYVL